MQDITIQTMTLENLIEVIDLWTLCELTRPWNDPKTDIEFALKHDNSTVLLASQGNQIIASIMIGHDGHRGWVYYLGVHPDHRNKSLGRKMMTEAENWLLDQGIWKLQLMVREDNEPAKAFYEAIGYADQKSMVMGRWIDPSKRGDNGS